MAWSASPPPPPPTGPVRADELVLSLGPEHLPPWAGSARWPGDLGSLLDGLEVEPLIPLDLLLRLPPGEHRQRLLRYARVRTSDATSLLGVLSREEEVALAWLAPAPAPPPRREMDPADIPPLTPDFDWRSTWKRPAPRGLDLEEAAWWPGGDGSWVTLADVEYAFDSLHEDLQNNAPQVVHGEPQPDYAFHGTAVLGLAGAADDHFGLRGGAPRSRLVVLHPLDSQGRWVVAEAVLRAAELLEPGDVLLVEQQSWGPEGYAPITADPAVFDAVALAVSVGITVVEPAGNGVNDLDDASWEGAFDPGERDSGSIMVGGGVPGPDEDARTRAGGNYGSRVSVQGWYRDIPSPSGPGYSTDLFHPFGDPHQAYTINFGGTSGASAQLASAATVLQSISLALHGEPIDPLTLRGWLVSTGQPQPAGDPRRIGPAPDLRAVIRTYLAR